MAKIQFYIIGGLLFSLFVAIFAIWNSAQIVIRFPFLGEYTTSQALVIIGSATLGALITLIFSLVKSFQLTFKIKKQSKKIKEYELIISRLEQEIEERQKSDVPSKTGKVESQ